jgi:hypothetical protein
VWFNNCSVYGIAPKTSILNIYFRPRARALRSFANLIRLAKSDPVLLCLIRRLVIGLDIALEILRLLDGFFLNTKKIKTNAIKTTHQYLTIICHKLAELVAVVGFGGAGVTVVLFTVVLVTAGAGFAVTVTFAVALP